MSNTAFGGSRTSRIFAPTPPSGNGSPEEELTRQTSSASISADPTTAGSNPYGNKPTERAGSSTRSIFHFTGHAPRWESEDDQASAGHTPYMGGTPRTQSRVALFTPMLTPKTEPEGMSWETAETLQHPTPQQPRILHGILKQKGSKQDLSMAHAEHDVELRHRPSVCGKCNQEICMTAPPTASTKLWHPTTMQGPGVSEAIARLEAERMAAEVEAQQPKPPSLTPSGSSSEKSTGSARTKPAIKATSWKQIADIPVTVDRETVSSSIPEMSPLPAPVISSGSSPVVAGPSTTKHHMLSRAANTMHALGMRRDSFSTSALPEMENAQIPLVQTPISQSTSRFHEDIPPATKSTPALATTSLALVDTAIDQGPGKSAPAPLQMPLTPPASVSPRSSAMENDPFAEFLLNRKTSNQPQTRPRWYPAVKARSLWMALRKPRPKRNKQQ